MWFIRVKILLVIFIIMFSLFPGGVYASQAYDLQTIMNRALQVNNNLQIQREEISQMQRRVQDSFRNFFPEASLTLSYGEEDYMPFSPLGQPYEYESQFRLAQPLWTGGRLTGVQKQNQAALQSAESEYHIRAIDTLEEATNAYFNILNRTAILEVRENIVSRAKEAYDMIRERRKIGEATRLDYLEVRDRYNQVVYERKQARNKLEEARLAFNRVIDQSLDSEIDVEIHEFQVKEDLPSEITDEQIEKGVQAGLDYSFAIQRIEKEVEYYRQGVQLARAHYLPEFHLEASQRNWGSDALDYEEDDYYLGVNMRMFLFGHSVSGDYTENFKEDAEGDRERMAEASTTIRLFDNSPDIITMPIDSRASVENPSSLDVQTKQAETRYEQQKINLDMAKKNVKEELKNRYFDYAARRLNIEVALDHYDFKTQQAEVVERQRREGEATLIEFLDALIEQATARTELIRAWYEYYRTQFEIDLRTGEIDLNLYPLN